ncbi:alpha/beta hydrolase [Nocardioides pantholopis]|uniref:alpha/beta hydrolase n=1 Tax=Nocardioides pantholopis TaxID=2483798 RepID=UPI000FDAB99D|nr:alpha/beta hydrolase [Nocardioides pantholopis]
MIERHYVNLPGGQLHYRRAGEGPPVVVLHSSPMSSAAMVPWIERLAADFTVYALDTPGYGQSDPLPYGGPDPEIPDYARRVVEFADALGLDRFVLGGTHTGSKIALATAVAAPGRVAQLVMDGLGLYTVEEMAEQLERYTPPTVPVWHGGHLVEAWHRMRNMWTFWPWYRQEGERRLDESMPSLADLHLMTMDMLRAGLDWGVAYRAAFRYDARAALGGLRVPALLIAKHADPLHEHLDRLRVEAPTMTVHSVGNEEHLDRLMAAFDRDLGLPDAPPSPVVEHAGGTTRRYVTTEHGVSHVRIDGDPAAPPLLLVHGSPGSADSFDALVRDLAADHLVIAPDTLGNGYSTPSRAEDPRIGDFADATGAVLEALGLAGVQAYGSHTGACISLELAVRRPDLVSSVVADGLPVLAEEERADLLENYFISMAPERHGEHLLRAWHTIRDVMLFWPWYRQDAAHVRPTGPGETEHLHRLVLEFLKSGPSYCDSYRAAFLFESQARLAAAEVPVLVCAAPDDMLRQGSEEASAGERVTFVELDPAAGRGAAWAVRRA